jgi:hypothetical protein
MTTEPSKKLTLQEQLAEKNRLEREKELANKNKPPITSEAPSQPPVNPELELKQFNATAELESKKAGYASLKEREKSLADAEKEFQAEVEAFGKKREKFEVEQKERVDKVNATGKLYNEKFALLQTKIAEIDKRTEETLILKTRAEKIIKEQTESEKENQAKSEAYEKNMSECLDLLSEIATILSNNSNTSGTGRILNYDVALIQRMTDHKCSLSSIADVISADCDRINEVCQSLQDNNTNPELLQYLSDNVEFIMTSLRISWSPATTEELK